MVQTSVLELALTVKYVRNIPFLLLEAVTHVVMVRVAYIVKDPALKEKNVPNSPLSPTIRRLKSEPVTHVAMALHVEGVVMDPALLMVKYVLNTGSKSPVLVLIMIFTHVVMAHAEGAVMDPALMLARFVQNTT